MILKYCRGDLHAALLRVTKLMMQHQPVSKLFAGCNGALGGSRQNGCTATWKHGYMPAWQHGSMAAWLHGRMAAWLHGCMVAGLLLLLPARVKLACLPGNLAAPLHGYAAVPWPDCLSLLAEPYRCNLTADTVPRSTRSTRSTRARAATHALRGPRST